MELRTTNTVQHPSQFTNRNAEVKSRENILDRINHIAKTEKEEGISIGKDGSLNLDKLSPRCIHSILLETEKLGLDYSIERSTVIRIQE